MMIFNVVTGGVSRVVVASSMIAAVKHVGGLIERCELLHEVAEVVEETKPRRFPEQLANDFMTFVNIKPSVMNARVRGNKGVADSRAALFWLMKQQGLETAEIGARFNRDPSTVSHGIQRAEMEMGVQEGGVYTLITEFQKTRETA